MNLFLAAILVSLAGPIVAPNPETPVSHIKPDRKYLFTDDSETVQRIISSGYAPMYIETSISEVEENTAFKITVQNYKSSDGKHCVQRVRIYQSGSPTKGLKNKDTMTSAPSTPTTTTTTSTSTTNKNWALRDELLATCDEDYALKKHSKYRFGFSNAIHFYGANRIIFKLFNGDFDYNCHERSYTKTGHADKVLTREKCETKISRIYTFQGTIRNVLWNIFHHSS